MNMDEDTIKSMIDSPEWNITREKLEEAAINAAKELMKHVGADSIHMELEMPEGQLTLTVELLSVEEEAGDATIQ
jgi:uncharacterized protein (DUF736 family)